MDAFTGLGDLGKIVEQKACRYVLGRALNAKDARSLLEMLGIWPDRELQDQLRRDRHGSTAGQGGLEP